MAWRADGTTLAADAKPRTRTTTAKLVPDRMPAPSKLPRAVPFRRCARALLRAPRRQARTLTGAVRV